jgi:hypothetical protein
MILPLVFTSGMFWWGYTLLVALEQHRRTMRKHRRWWPK